MVSRDAAERIGRYAYVSVPTVISVATQEIARSQNIVPPGELASYTTIWLIACGMLAAGGATLLLAALPKRAEDDYRRIRRKAYIFINASAILHAAATATFWLRQWPT